MPFAPLHDSSKCPFEEWRFLPFSWHPMRPVFGICKPLFYLFGGSRPRKRSPQQPPEPNEDRPERDLRAMAHRELGADRGFQLRAVHFLSNFPRHRNSPARACKHAQRTHLAQAAKLTAPDEGNHRSTGLISHGPREEHTPR